MLRAVSSRLCKFNSLSLAVLRRIADNSLEAHIDLITFFDRSTNYAIDKALGKTETKLRLGEEGDAGAITDDSLPASALIRVSSPECLSLNTQEQSYETVGQTIHSRCL